MLEDSSRQQPARDDRESWVHWGPTAAILYTFFLYFGGQFFAGFVFGFLSALMGSPTSLSEGGIAGQFYFVLLSDAVIIVALWLFLRSRRNGFRQLGFGRAPAWRDIGLAFAGYITYFGILLVTLVALGLLTGINMEQQQELGFDNLFSTAEKIMALIALVLLPPVVEELVFRGFLFTGLRTKLRFVWAALITSLLFAGPHLLASSEGLLWVAGVDTFVLSLVLCYLRERTGALWACVVVHAFKNTVAYLILLSGS